MTARVEVKVEVGQVWADNDSRELDRRVRVLRIAHYGDEWGDAYCERLPDGRKTRIYFDRFGLRRFRLISDPGATTP